MPNGYFSRTIRNLPECFAANFRRYKPDRVTRSEQKVDCQNLSKNRKISRRAKLAEDRKLRETTVMLQAQRQQQSVTLLPDSGENSKHLNQPIRCYHVTGNLDTDQF